MWLVPETHVIVRTERGFEPRELTIRPGDTVRFEASAEYKSDFWPASDAHPSHAFYPAMDPKRGLEGQETWDLVFDRPGVWPIHDHLHPGIRGTIRVLGKIPELEECMADYGTSTVQAFCWGQSLMEIVRNSGIDEAFIELESMNESPEFQRQCHDVMHILGQAAYDDFIDDAGHVQVHPLTSACGYGFYHGFIESMMVSEGVQDLSRAREYCEGLNHAQSLTTEISRSRAAEACYHGVGHALFDLVDSSLWGSSRAMVDYVTRQCTSLSDDEVKQIICMSGVYNSLANAYSSKSYLLTYALTNDADDFCAEEPLAYQSRCYVELTNGTVRNARFDFQKSIAHIRTLPAHARSGALRAYLDDEVRHEMQEPTPEKATMLCNYFTDTEERIDCMSAALRAFMYMSTTGKDDLASQLYTFCLGQNDEAIQTSCAGKARSHLSSEMPYEDVRRICSNYMEPAQCDSPSGEL